MVRAAAIALCLVLAGGGAATLRADPAPGDALAALRRSIAAAEQDDGADSPQLLPLLARLARAQFAGGDLPGATAADRRSLRIALAAFGAGSPEAVAAMTALAGAQLDQLHYLDAEALLVVANGSAAAMPGADAAARVAIIAGLARVALARGEPDVAQARAQRAVALAAKIAPYPTAPLRVLGAALAAQGKFAEGERVLKEAVARDRAGQRDDAAARSLSALGNLYLRADRFRDALAPLEQAAAIDQAQLAPDHPFIADDFHDIGVADEGLKRYAAARRILTAALHLLRRAPGKDRIRIALIDIELSHVDRHEGHAAAADAASRRARHILDAAADEERRREARI